MPQLATGAAAAEQMSNEGRTGGRAFLPDQRFKEKEDVFLRPYTEHDGWVSVLIHNFIKTKDEPEELAGPGSKWPETMWAMCQNDRAFRLRDDSGTPLEPPAFEEGYGECYIDTAFAGQKDRFDNDQGRPKRQVYGIFVARKPVTRPGDTRPSGMTDETVEVKNDKGETVMVPKLVLVSQKWSNFYAAIKAASYIGEDTVRDKDFKIRRVGTDYEIAVVNNDTQHRPGADSWKAYDDALELAGFDLGKYLLDHAAPDHYKRWFIPGAAPEGGYKRRKSGDDSTAEAGADQSAASAPVEPDLDADELAKFSQSLRDRTPAQQ